jgi:hypothetical protein
MLSTSPETETAPVAWIASHPDRGLNLATMAYTQQGATSRLMMTDVAGDHGWSVIPLYVGHAQGQQQPVAWQRRFRSSTTEQWGEWESSRLSEEEFRYRFDYLIKSGECDIRYLYAAISDSSTDREGK